MRVVVASVIAMTVTIASWPTTREVGVNFVVGRERLPLWKKAVEFIERDAQLRRISRDVLAGVTGDEAKAMTALAWTRTRIRHAPHGLPVIDDHILSVIDRGYGEADQQADVFATLLAYDDVPAYWRTIGIWPDVLPLSFVRIDGAWRMFDVTRGLIFRDRAGALAAVEEIARDLELVDLALRRAGIDDNDGYRSLFHDFQALPPPAVPRAELQMPWPRLSFELRKLMGAS